MSEAEGRTEAQPSTKLRRRVSFFQWSITTLLLLMAAVGVWTSYFRMTSDTERMQADMESLMRLARELIVADPTKYSIVEHHEDWYEDDVWDVHLPEGSRYVVKFATREIAEEGLPEADHVVELDPGRHTIDFKKSFNDLSAQVIIDGKVAIDVTETDDWKPGGGYSWGGGFQRSTQASTDKPLEIVRMRFHKRGANGSSSNVDGPYNGALLWIERK